MELLQEIGRFSEIKTIWFMRHANANVLIKMDFRTGFWEIDSCCPCEQVDADFSEGDVCDVELYRMRKLKVRKFSRRTDSKLREEKLKFQNLSRLGMKYVGLINPDSNIRVTN